MNEETLFEQALNLPEAERAAMLDRECRGDAKLRARVEALLAAHFASPLTGAYEATVGSVGTVVAGKYKLLQQIGEGGMGSVWMADQTEPVKRRVAVKLIRVERGSSQTILARFEAERQAIALMDHPHIAKLLDAGTTDAGQPYFAMELVKGIPLTEYCDAHKLSIPQRLNLFVQICSAVQHAHQKGIIHRDLKPTNILVENHDDKPVPKVIDFGLAKATSGMQLTENTLFTAFGSVMGTPLYMAPEQAKFNAVDIDTRADIYAMGVILYELLTGTTPLARDTMKQAALDEMLKLIREQEAPTPSSRLSSAGSSPNVAANRQSEPAKLGRFVKGELDWIVLKALSKERDRRYETANSFARDIERFLSHEPVQAGPVGAGYRLRKFVRRNRGQVVAASLIVFALLAGTVVATIGLIRAERARDGEAEQRLLAEAKTKEAEAERAAAVDARTKAMNALRSATDDVVEKLIGSKEKLGQAERAYIETALRRWQEFSAAEGSSEQTRSIRAEGYVEVAKLRFRLGQREEAIADWRETLSLYERLAADFPGNGAYRHKLALQHKQIGFLLNAYSVEGKRHLAVSCELLRNLTIEYPDVPEYLESLAFSMGHVNDEARDRTDPNWRVREQIAIYRRLVNLRPTEPRYQLSLANSLGQRAYYFQSEGNEAGDLEHRRAEVAVRENVRNLDPKNHENRRSLSNTLSTLSQSLRRSGDAQGAEENYRKAIVLREELAAEFHEEFRDPNAIRVMKAWHEGRVTSGMTESYWRAQIAEAEKNAKEFPSIPTNQLLRIQALENYGNVCISDDRYGEARDNYEQAMTYLLANKSAYVTPLGFDTRMAELERGLGKAYTGLQNRREADAHFRKAVALSEQLVRDSPPAYTHAKSVLGGTYLAYAKMFCEFDDFDGAIPWHDRDIATSESVLKESPQGIGVKADLYHSVFYRAMTLHRLKKFPQALNDWDRAIALSTQVQKPSAHANRAIDRAATGQVDEALADIAEALRSSDPYRPWFACACAYSVASANVPAKKQEYANQAMKLLQKSVDSGWTNPHYITKEPDFDPIRDREDYKKLVASLERIAPPPRAKP